MSLPDTRHSLLAKLHQGSDATAWAEFCGIYEAAIYRIARRFGMQDADAREVTQEVLLTVSRKIGSFDMDREGRFRGWLGRLARNATIDQLRRRRERGTGKSDVLRRLQEIPWHEEESSALFDREARLEQFRWAAEQVRESVSFATWQAFWLTAVEGQSGAAVAQHLDMTLGAVYVARCRTLARIRALIESFDGDIP